MIIPAHLPYFDQRKSEISMLVIHSMAFSATKVRAILEKDKLSSHYIIDYDGTIYQCVDESKRAWHAGISYWRGETDINSCSIGIELCHPDLGQTDFPQIQINSLIALCQDILKRHNIRPQMVVGHSDIAPSRKADPGKNFPWSTLAKSNIGLWYSTTPHSENNIKTLLDIIGYDTSSEGQIIASTYAFCRHFMPEIVASLPVEQIILSPYPKDKSIISNSNIIKNLKLVTTNYL